MSKPDGAQVRSEVPTDVGPLLHRISGECADISSALLALQGFLGDQLSMGRLSMSGPVILQLQEIDRITQTLADLARLSTALGQELDGCAFEMHEVRRALTLHSLQDRLFPS